MTSTPPLPPEEPFVLPRSRTGGRFGLVVTLFVLGVTLGVWGLAFAARWGVPIPVYAIPVLAFLPYVAVACIAITFTLWTLLPDRGLAALAVAIATASPLAQWGPSWAAHPDEDVGVPLRLMSWNVRRLWGNPDDEADATQCVAQAIQAEAPDAVVLLEVTRRDMDALSASLGLDCTWGTYRASDATSSSGLATCARGSVWRRVEGRAQAYTHDDDWQFTRSVLHHDTMRVALLGVHLTPYQILDRPLERAARAAARLPEVTARQTAQTRSLAEQLDTRTPGIIAGDFNTTRDTPQHTALRSFMRDAWEVGATGMVGTVRLGNWLPMRIDHVYVTSNIGVLDTEVRDIPCSDHSAIVTDLRIRP